MKDGGAAFPILDNFSTPHDGRLTCVDSGMTLRDYFAGQVLTALIENEPKVVAVVAYDFADAMLAEREKRNDKDNG